MSAYEPEIEEALKRYSLSSYAKLEDLNIYRLARAGDLGLNDVRRPVALGGFADHDKKIMVGDGNNALHLLNVTDTLEVEYDQEILTNAELGGAYNGGRATWDASNEEWIVTIAGPGPDTKARAAFFGSTWNLQDTQILDTHHNTRYGSGVNPIPYNKGSLLLVYDRHESLFIESINDMTARPLGTPTDYGTLHDYSNPSDCFASLMNNQLVTVFSCDTNRRNYTIDVAFGPRQQRSFDEQRLVNGGRNPNILPGAFDQGSSVFLGPSICSLFGRPLLFFTWNPQYNSGGPSEDKEIWIRSLPDWWLDPKTWFPLREVLPANTTTKVMPSFGADQLVVHLDADGTGTLEIHESSSDLNDFVSNNHYTTTSESISSIGEYKYIYNSPAPLFRIKTNFDGNVWVSLQ